jgi:hypothetical protein
MAKKPFPPKGKSKGKDTKKASPMENLTNAFARDAKRQQGAVPKGMR